MHIELIPADTDQLQRFKYDMSYYPSIILLIRQHCETFYTC